jgi:hypothetical protein
MKIILWALALAVAWTVTLVIVAHSPGLHSTPGIWTGVFGLPGVVVANWVRPFLGHAAQNHFGYAVMFLVNWIFYCSVVQGILSMKRTVWK